MVVLKNGIKTFYKEVWSV